MQHRHKLERVSNPADPRRCQANNGFGQCNFVALPNNSYCLMHSSKKTSNYNISSVLQKRVQEKANSKKLTDLSEELAILRVLLEEKLNTIHGLNDLILHSGELSEIIVKIEKLTVSLVKIQESQKTYLDKSRVVQFAEELITLFSEHVNADVLGKLADDIFAKIDSI